MISRLKNLFSQPEPEVKQPRDLSDVFYYRSFISTDSLPKKKFTSEELNHTLNKGMTALKEMGITCWVGRGTVLGPYRDNAFIKSDIDVDVSVYTDKRVYEILRHLPFEKVVVTTIHEGRYNQVSLLDDETGVIFDIWIYHDIDGKLYHRNYNGHFWLPKDILNRLIEYKIGEYTYLVPEPEWYLKYWYGKDWRAPKEYASHWSIDYEKDCEGFTRTTNNIDHMAVNYKD